jgi:hypothetical protein
MSDSQPFVARTLYDSLDLLYSGMNSGMAPLVLEKSQASYLANTTVRDGFATCRPPFSNQLTIEWPSPEVQTAIEEGLFQGATYYKPDSGPESLIAQIGGFLYQFTIVGDGVTVRDISVPGDPNPATATQAWLWQAEMFVIVNDGISLPIFFDGNTSRRSYGPTQVLGTTDGTGVIAAVGEVFTAGLATPYTGPFNVPVLIDGDYYQPIADANGYLVSAECLFDNPGTPITVGTEVTAKPSIAFVLAVAHSIASFSSASGGDVMYVTATESPSIPINSQVIAFGKLWRVRTIVGTTVELRALQSGTGGTLPAGYQFQAAGATAPNVVYGTVTVATVAPAIGGTVTLRLSTLYAGAPGQTVYIGAAGQYKITAVPPGPPGVGSIDLVNLTGTPGGTLAAADIISVPELPPGRMGAYGHAQNWVTLVDGISFLPSDISGAQSGTPAYQYRDAVLKTTNITFGSGNFRIPSAGDVITSMTFTSNLDVSMGQGPLMVGTERYIFSCVAPVDSANIAAIIAKGSPILTYALIGRGPLAQNSTINVNSDIQFRSTVGLGSLVIARQQFTSSLSGNTPISEEMVRVLNLDDKQLLPYSSAINFDNRVLFTASPQASSQGVFHTSLVAMNLDGLSSLRDKAPACYDGQWTGVNALQLLTGMFNGTSRAFAFTFNVSLSKIELYELLPTGAQHFDNGSVPITWSIETASLFNADVKPKSVFLQLKNGELAIDEVRGLVRIQVFYKPDQYGAYGEMSCWVPWNSFTVCAQPGSKPLYFPRLGFGEPAVGTCNNSIDAPTRFGRTFQVRLVITGKCRILNLRVAGDTQPVPQFQPPLCDVVYEVAPGSTASGPIGSNTQVVIVAGPPGPTGDDGAPGSVWRNGSGVPSNGLGIDGDYYLDDDTGEVYEKSGGTYSVVADITGPAGPSGSLTDGNYGDITVGGAGTTMTINANSVERSMLSRPITAQSVLTYAATVTADFMGDEYRILTLAGDVEFITSNRGEARSIAVEIIADGSNRNFTFPVGWTWLGDGEPASITANKVGVLSLTCLGANDSDVIAVYAVEP